MFRLQGSSPPQLRTNQEITPGEIIGTIHKTNLGTKLATNLVMNLRTNHGTNFLNHQTRSGSETHTSKQTFMKDFFMFRIKELVDFTLELSMSHIFAFRLTLNTISNRIFFRAAPRGGG